MKNSDWKSILNSKQKCVFNSYIHLKKPTHEMRYSYVNENPIRESVTAIFLDSEGDPAEGYEPFSCELDPGEVVKIDPKALLARDNFIGSSMLIIRPVNEEDTMIIKNKDAVTSWLAEDTACEIGTAAFPALNTKGVRENQSYYMFCSAVVSDEKRKTLCIGPKNEGELLTYWAHGFKFKNISGVDLFSYSPKIKVMDLHDLKFADNSFDTISCGWVLKYCYDLKKAVSEIIRVSKDGALLTIGFTVESEKSMKNNEWVANQVEGGLEQILELFGKNVGHIYWNCEDLKDGRGKGGLVFRLVK